MDPEFFEKGVARYMVDGVWMWERGCLPFIVFIAESLKKIGPGDTITELGASSRMTLQY